MPTLEGGRPPLNERCESWVQAPPLEISKVSCGPGVTPPIVAPARAARALIVAESILGVAVSVNFPCKLRTRAITEIHAQNSLNFRNCLRIILRVVT